MTKTERKAIIFCRIAEYTKPIKLEEQIRRCRDYAQVHNYNVISEISEVTNERRSKREGINRIKALIDTGQVDFLIVDKKEVLFHNLEDLRLFIRYCDNRNVLVLSNNDGLLNTLVKYPEHKASDYYMKMR